MITLNPKIQKGTLITIIILLVVFVGLTAAGFYFHFAGTPEENIVENPNHEFHYNNALWFYDTDNNLIGTYECETANCNFATSYTNDTEYTIDSYQEESTEEINHIDTLINNQYVFLTDFENIEHEAFLYDVKNGVSYKSVTYSSVKDYGIGIAENRFIVENSEHKYGVLQIEGLAQLILPFEYDFIGLINTTGEDKLLLSDYFVVLQDGNWSIVDANGAVLTEQIPEEIVTYNGSYIITVDTLNNYHIVNYQNERVLTEDFLELSFTDRYLNCVTLNRDFYVLDLVSGMPITNTYALLPTDTYNTEINADSDLEVYINNVLEQTIDL